MPPNRTPSWAEDFATFITNSARVDYKDLAQHWRDSQWKYRLVQKGTTVTPDGSVLVDTEMLIGPDVAHLEPFDTVTMRLPGGPGPVTLVTRVQLEQSLLAVVFGRFPPMPTAAEAAAVAGMNGSEQRVVTQPGRQGDIVLPTDGGEYVEPPAQAVNVIERREPDGLPIFVDLYALGGAPTETVLDAVLGEIEAFLSMAQSPEQINALAVRNPYLRAFIEDLGDDKDRSDLKAMIDARRRQLTVPAAAAAAASAPRRRVRGAQPN